jgi:hypothetical protein
VDNLNDLDDIRVVVLRTVELTIEEANPTVLLATVRQFLLDREVNLSSIIIMMDADTDMWCAKISYYQGGKEALH